MGALERDVLLQFGGLLNPESLGRTQVEKSTLRILLPRTHRGYRTQVGAISFRTGTCEFSKVVRGEVRGSSPGQ